eukprot:TRINITY_DN21277_c0_g1_i1.p1 TRINITY_DN21277_c0_g1~~TRINITY_DN21277_c0_g1_i1.p1  ORF type:complete len:397 (+),score=37.01 TRINITY_DN21277_c0_g1_i1:39-1229(+)
MFRRTFLRRYASTFRAADTKITRTSVKPNFPPPEQLGFGKYYAPHMLTLDWTRENGWAAPVIEPLRPFEMHPATSCLHYALQCFEGLKGYRDASGNTRMFRPLENCQRLKRSMDRLHMGNDFDPEELVKAIALLVEIEKEHIPTEKGYSLYIRPTGISTQVGLGVAPANSARIFVITSPSGPYYATGLKPVKLLADDVNVRAWKGGTGDFKIGGNYAPTIKPQVEAAKNGYQQILWLTGKEEYITEVGAMNFMVLWKNKQGEKELVTAPLSSGTVLPGITRDSILQLFRKWNEFKVTERDFTMPEFLEAHKDGRILEVFGCGTAAIVSPVETLAYKGTDFSFPTPATAQDSVALKAMDELLAIQYGDIEHEWSYNCVANNQDMFAKVGAALTGGSQ